MKNSDNEKYPKRKKTRYSIPVKLLSDEAQLPNQSAPILGTRTPLRSSLSSRKSSPDRSPFLFARKQQPKAPPPSSLLLLSKKISHGSLDPPSKSSAACYLPPLPKDLLLHPKYLQRLALQKRSSLQLASCLSNRTYLLCISSNRYHLLIRPSTPLS